MASTSSPVSIASSSSSAAAGGSVIDVSSLVSQLVTATQAPQEALITSQTTAVTTQISAVGTLKSALSTFQSALSSLDTQSAFDAQTANTSDKTVFTATAGSSAVAGSYAVTVGALASAQQLVSANALAANSSTTIGTGSLAVTLGGDTFNVNIDNTDDTLAGIASTINSASGNPGVTATVIQGTDGAHLVLSSTLTGAANTIQVAETDGGNALAGLTYGPGNLTHYHQEAAAQDAAFSVAGIDYTSASNTVTDAVAGVTLTLTGTTAVGDNATLSVANDTSSIEQNVQSFVTAYNTLVGTFNTLGSYDATSSTAGPLMGNSLLTGIQNEVKSALYSVVNTGSSSYDSLASVGVISNSDGSLSLNSGTLSNALATNFSAVSQLFGGTGGVATQLNTALTGDLSTTGSIASKITTLTAQNAALTKQSTQLQDQMTALTASLTQQYSALNTLLSSLQTTSAYLTQAFSTLPSVQDKSSA